jgi:hypothetical protein
MVENGRSDEPNHVYAPHLHRRQQPRAGRCRAQALAACAHQVSRRDHKRELAALEQLATAFDAWDRFDHKTSKNLLENVEQSANDLRAVFG